jgi:hypothetical protein
MVSHPFSNLRFLTAFGTPLDVPSEWMPALVEVLAPAEDWEQIRLSRQGHALPVYLRRLGDQVRMLADWPRSGPGHYRLKVELPDQIEEDNFTIQPQKISPIAFAQLLEDLQTQLPATVAFSLQRAGALAGIKLLPPGETTIAQELVRLRRAVDGTDGRPGLTDVLKRLARDPHQILKTTELWVVRERARRPHPALFVQALSRGHNIDADGRPQRVLDTRVEHTVDVYENRLVNIFVHQVQLRLRRLVRTLEVRQNTALLELAQKLLTQLLHARQQAAFLNEVSLPSHLPTQLTMVLLNRPAYRAALEGYLEFHRSAAVRLEEPALEAPLENLPRLYQVWGTLKVIAILLHVAVELGYRVQEQHLVQRDATGVYIRVLPDGKSAVVLQHPVHRTIVQLIPERAYRTSGALRSISYEQRPDVAIEIERAGEQTEIYLFDPKYKLDSEQINDQPNQGKPQKVDIDKMHAYRDAIRDGHGTRVVHYAATLYPGQTVHYAEGIATLRAYPGEEHTLEHDLRTVFREILAAPSQLTHTHDPSENVMTTMRT